MTLKTTPDGFIIVESQDELDAAIAADGGAKIEIGGTLDLSLRVPGLARPFIRLTASARLAVLAGKVAVEAWGSSHVEARGSSHVVAWGSSHVVARGSSHVEARGSSHVEAWESSHVEARGDVFVRLFSALSVKASARVAIMVHGRAGTLEGGRQMLASPTPTTGKEWCEYYGIEDDAAFKVADLDAKIVAAIDAGKGQLRMDSWHGRDDCDDTNWCGTTHCRAGYAICLAGKPGFDLARKVGDEMAGRMIYAVSRPDKPLPDFFASDADAMEDLRASAAEAA